jgi:hypothetical protein
MARTEAYLRWVSSLFVVPEFFRAFDYRRYDDEIANVHDVFVRGRAVAGEFTAATVEAGFVIKAIAPALSGARDCHSHRMMA